MNLRNRWRKKLRAVTKQSGVEGKRCCLRVSLDILKASAEVKSCLDSIIDLGYDLSLFERAELDIMCTKTGYFLNISKNMKKNFNCVIVADNFRQSAPYFANENICIYNCGSYEDYLLPYAKELMPPSKAFAN